MSIDFFLDNRYYTGVGDLGPFKGEGFLNKGEDAIVSSANWLRKTVLGGPSKDAPYVLSNKKVARAKNNVVLGVAGIIALQVLGLALKAKGVAQLATLGVLVFNVAPGACVWVKAREF